MYIYIYIYVYIYIYIYIYVSSDWLARNSVRLAIRKLTYAPEEPAPQPNAEAVKEFMMSPGNLRLEASLDKEVNLLCVNWSVTVGKYTVVWFQYISISD